EEGQCEVHASLHGDGVCDRRNWTPTGRHVARRARARMAATEGYRFAGKCPTKAITINRLLDEALGGGTTSRDPRTSRGKSRSSAADKAPWRFGLSRIRHKLDTLRATWKCL